MFQKDLAIHATVKIEVHALMRRKETNAKSPHTATLKPKLQKT